MLAIFKDFKSSSRKEKECDSRGGLMIGMQRDVVKAPVRSAWRVIAVVDHGAEGK